MVLREPREPSAQLSDPKVRGLEATLRGAVGEAAHTGDRYTGCVHRRRWRFACGWRYALDKRDSGGREKNLVTVGSVAVDQVGEFALIAVVVDGLDAEDLRAAPAELGVGRSAWDGLVRDLPTGIGVIEEVAAVGAVGEQLLGAGPHQ